MKIVMIYDQIQSGAGTKDDKMVPLNITKEKIGPTVMMEQYLKANNCQVIATLYCGNGYFKQNEEEVVRKLVAMVKKLNADVVVCGPSLNYLEYSEMCAKVAAQLIEDGKPALCAMSEENEAVLARYKDIVPIVKCPRKGGLGLNNTLKAIVEVASDLAAGNQPTNADSLY